MVKRHLSIVIRLSQVVNRDFLIVSWPAGQSVLQSVSPVKTGQIRVVNPVPRTYVRGFGHFPGGKFRTFTREIGARAVFKVSTEEIISRGESPRSRTGRSVIRGKPAD